MLINFVTETEKQRWVLRYWSESLAKHIPNAMVSTEPFSGADCNIFVNYALYAPGPTKTAAIFTHREFANPLRTRFDFVAAQVDWCFAQCKLTANLLPSSKTSVLRMYPEEHFYKSEIVVGVAASKKLSGRKRFTWVPALQAVEGIRIIQATGNVPFDKMPQFYRSLDYLVVLADNEGGPMPVLEALAMGVPVIAPNVGHCWNLPVLRYTSKSELVTLLKSLVIPKDGWKQSAREMVWVLQKLL